MVRKIKKSAAESEFIGALPQGCRQCIRGEKLVLFVTGICPKKCFYCPLSGNRKDKDVTFANEAPVKTDGDIITEARLCSAKGAGLTGGDPLVRIERTLHYIRLLKSTFGQEFHIHLYTSGELATPEVLSKLKEAGLDEIRYHVHDDPDVILPALKTALDAGAEVPAVPGEGEKLKSLVKFLDDAGAKFININELEMSELNAKEMARRGFETCGDVCNSVFGSREVAEKALLWARANTRQLSVHFCNSRLKDVYQYNNRLKRRAKNVKQPYETIVRGCLLRKGVIYAREADAGNLGIEHTFRRGRIECSAADARCAAKKGYKAAIVLENPAYDAFDVEVEPLKCRGKVFDIASTNNSG